MIERIIILDNVDPVSFYGVNNSNMQLIKNLYPKLRVSARGSVIKVIGEESETADFEKKIKALEAHTAQYNSLGEDVIIDIVKGEAPRELKRDDVIIYGISGKPIVGRTPNQQKLVEEFSHNDLTFALGPAGTGKTFLAVAAAVDAFERGTVERIVLTRPAVEAGERLGFLPGDLTQKVDPYLRPLYDALFDLMGFEKSQRLMERQSIEVAPLAYMRGRTLNNAFVILDEAQNTTPEQMKMFLTRIGFGSKAVITGDVTQIDLPKGVPSGLKHAIRILDGVRGIEITRFTSKDVVRHPLVARIVDAYEEAAKQDELAAKARKEVKE